MAQLREKIVKLCKVVGGLTGMINKIDENAQSTTLWPPS